MLEQVVDVIGAATAHLAVKSDPQNSEVEADEHDGQNNHETLDLEQLLVHLG